MPIPCVDVIVANLKGQILLVQRSNEPMKDEWWFPGGRVLFKENRAQAAIRKILEECGLDVVIVSELGTYDLILDIKNRSVPSHAISTLFHAQVTRSVPIKLDLQSRDAQWHLPKEWLNFSLPDFIRKQLLAFEDNS